MDRTLSMVIVSFVLGALVSITIQACGGDENKFEQDCGSGNSTSSANCECSWESQNMAYYEICDENGQISNRWDYVYDNKGRMVEAKSVQYQKGYPSGKRYLSFVNHSVYTYSDSGDCRRGSFEKRIWQRRNEAGRGYAELPGTVLLRLVQQYFQRRRK